MDHINEEDLEKIDYYDEGMQQFGNQEQLKANNQMLQQFNYIQCFDTFIAKIRNPGEQSVNYRKYKEFFESKFYKQKLDANDIKNFISQLTKLKKQNKLKTQAWNHKQIAILIWLVQKYDMQYLKSPDEFTENDWRKIASMIPTKNAEECQFKWIQFKKYKLIQFPWSKDQNELLIKLVEKQLKEDWKAISRRLFKEAFKEDQERIYRTPKQCKMQYNCHLKRDLIKSKWTQQQDIILLQLYLLKNNKWLQISRQIKGRTQNAVKNRLATISKYKFKIPFKSGKDQENLRKRINQYLHNNQTNKMIDLNGISTIHPPSQHADDQHQQFKKYKQQQQAYAYQSKSSVKPKNPQISISNSKSVDCGTLQGSKTIIFRRLGITQILKQLLEGEQVYAGIFQKYNSEIKIKMIMPTAKQEVNLQVDFELPQIYFLQDSQDIWKVFDEVYEKIDQVSQMNQ